MKKFIKLTKLPITESKKYKATFLVVNKEGKEKEKVVRFGAQGYRDYTLMNQKGNKHYLESKAERVKVKNAYRARHEKDLETKDFTRAGYLSYFLLWSKPTIGASIAAYKKKFRV